MKKISVILFAMILTTVLFSGCDGDKPPDLLPEYTYIYDVFAKDGTIYTLRYGYDHNISRAYITKQNDAESFYALPGGEDTVWSDSAERLFYSNGCTIYSCDMTGNDETALWTLPDGTKADYATVAGVYGDMLVIHVGYGERNSGFQADRTPYIYSLYEVYSLDSATGKATLLLGNLDITQIPREMGRYDNEVFYLDQVGNYKAVMGINLSTAEIRQLGMFESSMSVNSAEFYVLDEILYFTYNNGGVYHVPLAGGDVEYNWPDKSNVPNMMEIASMRLYDGKFYLLLRTGNSYWTARLCAWDMETNSLKIADTEKTEFSEAEGFIVENGNYYVYSALELFEGTLK